VLAILNNIESNSTLEYFLCFQFSIIIESFIILKSISTESVIFSKVSNTYFVVLIIIGQSWTFLGGIRSQNILAGDEGLPLKEIIKEAILEGDIPNEYNAAYELMINEAKKLGLKK